jgi:hypothetical protein
MVRHATASLPMSGKTMWTISLSGLRMDGTVRHATASLPTPGKTMRTISLSGLRMVGTVRQATASLPTPSKTLQDAQTRWINHDLSTCDQH